MNGIVIGTLSLHCSLQQTLSQTKLSGIPLDTDVATGYGLN